MSQPVNMEELNSLIKTGSLFLLDIFAGWCHPCKLLDREIESLEKDLPWLNVAKIDFDKAEGLSEAIGIRSLPLLILYNEGNEILRIKGYYSADKLLDEIRKALPQDI